MKVLLVRRGDTEYYAALTFEEHYEPKEVALSMIEAGERARTIEIELKDAWSGEPYSVLIICTLHDFGPVDPAFIDFMEYYITDYDDSKHTNYYVIES